MSMLASPRFLRNVLLADAASCFATGALQLTLSDSLSRWLGLPAPLLAGTGAFLLACAALAAFVATRSRIPRGAVWLFVGANALWALGCFGLLAGNLVTPTGLGTAWLVLQAVTVAVLAELQWMGLRPPVRQMA
jgi:hypothetical protein